MPCRTERARGSELNPRGARPKGDPRHFLAEAPGRQGQPFVKETTSFVRNACHLCIEITRDPSDLPRGDCVVAGTDPAAPPPPTALPPNVECLVNRATIGGSMTRMDVGELLPFDDASCRRSRRFGTTT